MQIQGIDVGSALDGFEDVSPSGSGQYINPGDYILKIESAEMKKGYQGLSFIGANTVVKVLKAIRDEDGNVVSNSEGDGANHVVNLTKGDKTLKQGNLKAYLLAGFESRFQQKLDIKQVNNASIGASISAAQPLRNVYIHCSAFERETKDGKGKYTAKNFRMMTNSELEQHGLQQPPLPQAG